MIITSIIIFEVRKGSWRTQKRVPDEIALDFSKGCDTISQSIATSGSVVNEAGMSFEKYAALVSTTAEKTRVSGSQIGNAFKTIFSRISRSKDGLTTDAEMSDAEAALKSVGVSVRRADGDLRDISDTLDDLNKVCIMQWFLTKISRKC